MNTINASLHLTHFHLHHDDDRDAHEHVRVYDRVHAHVYDRVRVYGRVHAYDHGYVHARVHRLHGNVHDELYLKAV